MENASLKEKRTMIIIAVFIALVAALCIPYSYWDTDIVSGRPVSEATIVDKGKDSIVVRLFTMTSSEEMIETGTFLLLEGYIPEEVHIGQRVRIGYSFDGLFECPTQSVQIAYFVDGNLLTGFFLKSIVPFQSAATDLRIANIQSDGSSLAYNRAS